MILNLDPDFQIHSTSNALSFDVFTFNGGEPHIKIKGALSASSVVKITQRIRSFNDLGVLLTAIDALKRTGVEKIELFLPYFPAARQDRIMQAGEALTVKVYADLINALQLQKIQVFDPHSDVVPALLNNCEVLSNHLFIQQVVKQIQEEVILVSPDGGALKKVYPLAQFLGGLEVVECSKKRNPKTGQLSDFQVYADDLKNKNCLIVDDICDGGRTFIGLAKALRKKNANQLYLAVSHGIFSRGFEELAQYFEHIFTTDAFGDLEEMDGMTQILLKDLLVGNAD
ncbi:MAG: ribose-phosphate diphosphokinase [Bacteroidota bacterium]